MFTCEPSTSSKTKRQRVLVIKRATATSTKQKQQSKAELQNDDKTDGSKKKTHRPPTKEELEQGRKHRETILNLLQYSNASLIRKIDREGFHCFVCPKTYAEADELKEHFISIHSLKQGLRTLNLRNIFGQAKVDVTALTCSLCDQEIKNVDFMLEHLRVDHKKKTHEGCYVLPFKFDKPGYCCAVCDSNFRTFKAMLSHMHSHYQNFFCDICQAGFFNKTTMQLHRNIHNTTKDGFSCTHCSKTFEKDSDRVDHERKDHSGLKPRKCARAEREQGRKHRETILSLFQYSNASLIRKIDHGGFHCGVCPVKFPEAAQLKDHFITVHLQKEALKEINFKHLFNSAKVDITGLTCLLCDQKFENVDIMLKHLRVDHGKMTHEECHVLPFKFDNPGYSCVICEFSFGTFKSLTGHMHSHYQNYICDICETGFYNKSRMLAHRNGHTAVKKAFTCKHCSKTFDTSSSRITHMKRVHLGLKPYTCHHCSEKFQDYYERMDHCIEVHGLKDMGNFQCRACDKKFRRSYALRLHVRKDHLMEKLYACSVCSKRFRNERDFEDHKMMHASELTQYLCGECDKVFNRKRSLQRHMQGHFPPQYSCQFCDKTFFQKSGYTYHLRIKHGVVIIQGVQFDVSANDDQA